MSGTANNVFFSDARVFNPNDKDITIQAYYYERGNVDRSSEQAVTFTVTKRQMRVFDDIVQTLFSRGGVGAIRFVSQDDFVATQRVYAVSTTACAPGAALPCTLGQFVQGQDLNNALTKGAILQLKSNAKFRTNIGAANPNNATAKVTWRLYDKNNAVIAKSPAPVEMPPYAVIGPTGITDVLFYEVPAGADLTDAWVSFVSDLPIFAYGSVVDNGSTDQTYVPGLPDTGTPLDPSQPPQPKIVTITARDFVFNVTAPQGLKSGDQVTFRLIGVEGTHGFQLVDPQGNSLVFESLLTQNAVERTVTLRTGGTYSFFCTNSGCGTGHFSMVGSIIIGAGDGSPNPPDRY